MTEPETRRNGRKKARSVRRGPSIHCQSIVYRYNDLIHIGEINRELIIIGLFQ